MGIEEVLAVCAKCKKIRINDDDNLWLDKAQNKSLYYQLIDRYKGRLSHGFCPTCLEDWKTESRLYIKNK